MPNCIHIIEKEVVEKFSTNSIIDECSSMKECEAQFTFKKGDCNFKIR